MVDNRIMIKFAKKKEIKQQEKQTPMLSTHFKMQGLDVTISHHPTKGMVYCITIGSEKLEMTFIDWQNFNDMVTSSFEFLDNNKAILNK